MKLFFAYLRQRWKVLLGAVLFYALFAVSFALYGLPLAACVSLGNVHGCQFHPEKSGKVGLSILKAFCELR